MSDESFTPAVSHVPSSVCLPFMLCVFLDICLQSGAKGGFESDSQSIDSFCVVDGKFNGENSAFLNGLYYFTPTFQS